MSGDTDDYGNEIPTETLVNTTCEIQQQLRDEPVAAGEVSRTRWLAIFPIGTELHTDDAVLVEGAQYEVDGDVWQADSGTSAVHHVEATLLLVAGAEDTAS